MIQVTIRKIESDIGSNVFTVEGVSHVRAAAILAESGLIGQKRLTKHLIHHWVEFENVDDAIEFKLRFM